MQAIYRKITIDNEQLLEEIATGLIYKAEIKTEKLRINKSKKNDVPVL